MLLKLGVLGELLRRCCTEIHEGSPKGFLEEFQAKIFEISQKEYLKSKSKKERTTEIPEGCRNILKNSIGNSESIRRIFWYKTKQKCLKEF